jgi:hypothetical protein
MVPDIPTTTIDSSPETKNSPTGDKTDTLVFYDMPGLSDNRGIEVALANTVVMSQVIREARSVKLVMVFEHGQLGAEKGDKWREAIAILEERFNNNLRSKGKSLCVVITKTPSVIEKDSTALNTIKKDIVAHSDNKLDLSNHVVMYNPLNPCDKKKLLDTIFETEVYGHLNTKISVSKAQSWEALTLGRQIQTELQTDLANNETSVAQRKVQFTCKIAKLGNQNLTEPHKLVEATVLAHANTLIAADIEQPTLLGSRVQAYKQYAAFKKSFESFVNFAEPDRLLGRIIQKVEDPRYPWEKKPGTFTAGSVVAALLASLAGGMRPLLLPIVGATNPALVPLLVALPFARLFLAPTEDEKDLAAFFKGPKRS